MRTCNLLQFFPAALCREAYAIAQLWVAAELCARCLPAVEPDERPGAACDSGNQVPATRGGSCNATGGAQTCLRASESASSVAPEVAAAAGRQEQRGCSGSSACTAVEQLCDCPSREDGAKCATTALEALRAVDLALILGAPAEAAAPVHPACTFAHALS